MSNTITELDGLLMQRSLTDPQLLAAAEKAADYRILPDATVIKIGGQSMIDRGRAAVYPLVDEIVAARKAPPAPDRHRRRHPCAPPVFDRRRASPAGRRAVAARRFGRRPERRDARAAARQARHLRRQRRRAVGRAAVPRRGERGRSSAACRPTGCGCAPRPEGVIPPYRTDAGCFLVAEQFGCKAMIYVKDEDGLYTANPKTSKNATFIPEISVDEMKASGLQDSILEFPVLDLLNAARHVRQVQIINGLVPGNLTRALAGEHVGTIITAS